MSIINNFIILQEVFQMYKLSSVTYISNKLNNKNNKIK